jgi:hypothetical protein
LKTGDLISPFLFKFASENAIMKVQVNEDSLKLKGAHQLLVYAEDVNILGESVHTMKENTDDLVVASNEIGPEKMLIKLSTCSRLEIRIQDKSQYED